jgi:hypothetical protein
MYTNALATSLQCPATVQASQGGETQRQGTFVAVALPVLGALLGLVGGFLLLRSLPGRDSAGTALVLLLTTAVGVAAGVLLSIVVHVVRWVARRPAPEPEPPAPEPEPEPEPQSRGWRFWRKRPQS